MKIITDFNCLLTQVKVFFSYVLEDGNATVQQTSQQPTLQKPAQRGFAPFTKIVLHLDSKDVTLNGISKTVEVPPTLMNESTMVPLRFIAEVLGATVNWDGHPKNHIKLGWKHR